MTTLIGEFGKGIQGSIALNFSRSGADNCSDTCELKGKGCYAEKLESFRGSLRGNLEWKESNPVAYLRGLVGVELPRIASAPWVRFSAFGSVPAKPSATQRALLAVIAGKLDHTKVHLPVETREKADTYRALGYSPRWSMNIAAVSQVIQAATTGYKLSMVAEAPDKLPGWTKRAKERAKVLAKQIRAEGVSAKVCPAIIRSAKCGACKLCAGTGTTQVVVYPEHP